MSVSLPFSRSFISHYCSLLFTYTFVILLYLNNARMHMRNHACCFAASKIPSTLEHGAISILLERGYAYLSVSIDPSLVLPLTRPLPPTSPLLRREDRLGGVSMQHPPAGRLAGRPSARLLTFLVCIVRACVRTCVRAY